MKRRAKTKPTARQRAVDEANAKVVALREAGYTCEESGMASLKRATSTTSPKDRRGTAGLP